MARTTKERTQNCVFAGACYDVDKLPKDRRPQIALAGRSNVGKSSLLNKLAGQKKLAKVSSTPGKTRSVNLFLVGDKYYLVDLPGYGYAKAPKAEREAWAQLVEDYFYKSAHLAGLVFLLDCRRETSIQDIELLGWVTPRKLPTVVVLTKADKLSRDKINRKVAAVQSQLGLTAIPFSTVTGQGKNELGTAIRDLLSGSHS
jgi:GTP-binding protein